MKQLLNDDLTNHRFFVVYDEVIEPAIADITDLMNMDEVPELQIWDAEELTTDHGNEYTILLHVIPNEEVEHDERLMTIVEMLLDIPNKYLGDHNGGDYHIEVHPAFVLNNSIVVPVTMLK